MIQRPLPQSREDQARLEIGRTEVSPGVKWLLFAVGLFTLYVVPAVQTYRELRRHALGQRDMVWPQWCDIFAALPRAVVAFSEHNGTWTSKARRGNDVLLEAIDEYVPDGAQSEPYE